MGAADRAFPDRRGAGTASVVRAARDHGPRCRWHPRSWSWSRVTAQEANGGDAAMPPAPLAGARVRSRTRARAPGRLGPGNATAGQPMWFSSPRHGRHLWPRTTAPCPASRWVIREITENARLPADQLVGWSFKPSLYGGCGSRWSVHAGRRSCAWGVVLGASGSGLGM